MSRAVFEDGSYGRFGVASGYATFFTPTPSRIRPSGAFRLVLDMRFLVSPGLIPRGPTVITL